MPLEQTVIDGLDDPIPTTSITERDSVSVTTTDGVVDTTYPLSKTPFERLLTVTATLGGVEQDVAVGDDVIPQSSPNSDGFDSFSFTDVTPDPDTTIRVEYETTPYVVSYANSYQQAYDSTDERIDGVIDNKSVETASSRALDRIGAQYGRVGQRNQRSDSVYRAYLRSLVPAFNANGTMDDIKIAAGAASGLTPDDITIEEDTDLVGFRVIIPAKSVDASSELSNIIRIASPSGVELLNEPIVRDEKVILTVSQTTSTSGPSDGLGTSSLGDGTLGSRDGHRSL